MKIRQKVALLVAAPLVAVLVFATLAVLTTGSEALQAERMRNLVTANKAVGQLAYNLQTERTLAVQTLLKSSKDDTAEEFLNHQKDTDKSIDRYRSAIRKLSEVPSTTRTYLDNIDSGLSDLESVRKRISDRKQGASVAAFTYRITIADLLSYRESVPQAGNVPSDSADRIRASNLLSRSIEYQSIETETVLRALEQGDLSASAFQKITAANTGSTDAALTFNSLAPTEWQEWLDQALTGDELMATATMEDEALRSKPGQEPDIDATDWAEGMNKRAEKHRDVQERVDTAVVNDITTIRDEQYQWTATQLGGVVVAVIIALLMAVWLGGPIVRGLRRLRDSAHKVATVDLPRAVAELDTNSDLGGQTPEEFARKAEPPVKVKGRDELADVGRAFNEVHQEAIRVAAHQALLRLHIGGMFVRLARRGHSLAGRLTNVLDEAERNEQDPDRLDRLFKLDHLVTLFGRTNDSLLVLGGAAPARARRSNETVGNVLTASQSQIEQYTRVQIGLVDEGVSIKAVAVDDVVKLVAELLDNGAQYSQHAVNITARLLADRMVIQISDRGMGMPPEKIQHLNKRLASRNPIDLDSFQTMGLTVVGHIAAQHNIEVELRAAATGGTLAEVSLPVEVIEIATEPKAITAVPEPEQPEPARPRGGPLFKRRDKSDQPQNAEPKTSKKKRSKASKAPTADDSSSGGSAGLPRIQFDFASIPVDPGRPPVSVSANEQHTSEQPAVPRQRGMHVSGLSSFSSASQAAEQATAPMGEPTQDGGLPKRDPMSRLVPGTVESSDPDAAPTQEPPTYRDPVSVGAAYVAFAKTRPGTRL